MPFTWDQLRRTASLIAIAVAGIGLLSCAPTGGRAPANGETAKANATVADKVGGDTRYKSVLALKPVGYWPADEGKGALLHDRSGNGNHGTVCQVDWANGLLNFTAHTYQWLQIPNRREYEKSTFSMGGWVFTRTRYRAAPVIFFGPQVARNSRWGGWVGNLDVDGTRLVLGPAPGSRELSSLCGLVSGRKHDVLGSMKKKVSVPVGRWTHLFYVFNNGSAQLYLDGKMVASAKDVPFKASGSPFLVGCDAAAWRSYPPGDKGLNGSARDLLIFDRVITPKELGRIIDSTRPDTSPRVFTATAIAWKGRVLSEDMLATAGPEQKRKLFSFLVTQKKFPGTMAIGRLVQIAEKSLGDPRTLCPAIRVLVRLGAPGKKVLKESALPAAVKLVADTRRSKPERAEAALALREMKDAAVPAVPALTAQLAALVDKEGARLPRVEDLLRNALISALLALAPEQEDVRVLLSKVYAKPFIDRHNLARPHLAKLQPLVKEGRYMDALDAYGKQKQGIPKLPGNPRWGHVLPEVIKGALPLAPEHFEEFLSKGTPFSDVPYAGKGLRPYDYTSVATYKGTVYLTTVERIDAKSKWSRLKLVEIRPDRTTREYTHEGDWFIFNAADAKIDGWSIGVDRDGYIHLIGGQHNQPREKDYRPETWKRLNTKYGNARNKQMYWVSKKPGSMAAFEFVGKATNPRCFQRGRSNYMNFVRSPDGTLFMYGRGNAWSWGLSRYDAVKKRWTYIAGNTADLRKRTAKDAPAWNKAMGHLDPALLGKFSSPAFVYSNNPGTYDFCRSSWGIRFDPTGRMHANLMSTHISQDYRLVVGKIYAWSDDRGTTWHRADGAPLKLPLSCDPASAHCADLEAHSSRQWFELWCSLIKRAGYKTAWY